MKRNRLIATIIASSMILSTSSQAFACEEIANSAGDAMREYSRGAMYDTSLEEILTPARFDYNSLFSHYTPETGIVDRNGVRLNIGDVTTSKYVGCDANRGSGINAFTARDYKEMDLWVPEYLHSKVRINKDVVKKGYLGNKTGSKLNIKATVTRAEFVVMLANMIEVDGHLKDTGTMYEDAIGKPYESAVRELLAAGILPGSEYSNFKGETSISRGDVLSICSILLNTGHTNENDNAETEGWEGSDTKIATNLTYPRSALTACWIKNYTGSDPTRAGSLITELWVDELDTGIRLQDPIKKYEMVTIINNTLHIPLRSGAEAQHIKNYTDIKSSSRFYDTFARACV